MCAKLKSKYIDVLWTGVCTVVKERQIYDMREGEENAGRFEFKVSVWSNDIKSNRSIIPPCFGLPTLRKGHLFSLASFSGIDTPFSILAFILFSVCSNTKTTLEQSEPFPKTTDKMMMAFTNYWGFLMLCHLLGQTYSKYKTPRVNIPIFQPWFLEAGFHDRVFASSTVNRKDTTVGNWGLCRRSFALSLMWNLCS